MFNKEKIKELESQVELYKVMFEMAHDESIRCNSVSRYNIKPEYVECETCGCLLNKSTAFKGESTIVKAKRDIFKDHSLPLEETIKENYYCKIHKPKPLKRA